MNSKVIYTVHMFQQVSVQCVRVLDGPFCLRLTDKTSHLSGRNSIIHWCSHLDRVFRSSFIREASASLVIIRYIIMSLANRCTVPLMFLAMSLMLYKNRQGPRTEPWRTPDVTGLLSEQLPSTISVTSGILFCYMGFCNTFSFH